MKLMWAQLQFCCKDPDVVAEITVFFFLTIFDIVDKYIPRGYNGVAKTLMLLLAAIACF